MLAIKKLVTLSPALTLTILGPVLFNGCSPSGPRALLQGERLLRDGKYAQAVQKLELAAQLLPKDARAWNHLGLAYHDAGRPGDAGKAYQQALALDRNLAAAHYNLGCLHFDQNNIPAAVTELTSYTGLQPNAPEGWTKLGAAQLRARQLDVAEKNLRQALKLDPHLPEAWNGLGLVQTQRRHYPEAYQHFYAAWREQRDYAPALLNLAVVSQQYLNGRPFALQKYKEYLALKPQPPNSTAVQQIANELELELHPPARPALTNTPAQLAVLTNQPTPAVMTNKPTPASAGKSLAASATLPATTPPIRTNAATSAPPTRASPATSTPSTKTESQTVPPAKVEVVRLTDEEPIKPAHDAAVNVVAGQAETTAAKPANTNSTFVGDAPNSEASKQKNGFVQHINPRNWFRAKERPDSPLPTTTESNVTDMTTTRAPKTASAPRPAYARYKYRSPAGPKPGNRGEAERLLAQGVQAQEGNRLTEAVEKYRQAIKADPSFFDAQYNLGVAAYETGDLPQSLLAYEYALTINPLSVKARFNLAVALQKSNYPRDAANELLNLLAESPDEARAHFALANLYAQQLGEPANARAHYMRLLELDPQHPQVTAIRYWLEANP